MTPTTRHRLGRYLLPATVIVILISAPILSLQAQQNLGKGRISGDVLDGAGNPVQGVRIVAESLQGSTTTLEGTTDRKGHFAVAGLGTGPWRVTAAKEGYVDASLDIQVSQLKANPPVSLVLRKAVAAGGSEEGEGRDLLGTGRALFESGDLEGALAAFSEFVSRHPDLYQARLNTGSVYMAKEDYGKAEEEFLFVLERVRETHGVPGKDKETALKALTGLGETALRRGDLEAARGHFSEALAISPEDEVGAYNVGEILFSNQRTGEAIEYFELAVTIKPDWAKPRLRLGYAYLNQGHFEKSLGSFRKFLELEPDSLEAPNVKNVMAAVEKMKK